jgi:hypothetical protein
LSVVISPHTISYVMIYFFSVSIAIVNFLGVDTPTFVIALLGFINGVLTNMLISYWFLSSRDLI